MDIYISLSVKVNPVLIYLCAVQYVYEGPMNCSCSVYLNSDIIILLSYSICWLLLLFAVEGVDISPTRSVLIPTAYTPAPLYYMVVMSLLHAPCEAIQVFRFQHRDPKL